jgi:hypothetical protein
MTAPQPKLPDFTSTPDDFVPKEPSRTSSWDRAVVFDPKNSSVHIRKKSEVETEIYSGKYPVNGDPAYAS